MRRAIEGMFKVNGWSVWMTSMNVNGPSNRLAAQVSKCVFVFEEGKDVFICIDYLFQTLCFFFFKCSRQICPIEPSAKTECSYTLAVQDGRHYHLWLLSTLNVLCILDKLSFKMQLILINLNACM